MNNKHLYPNRLYPDNSGTNPDFKLHVPSQTLRPKMTHLTFLTYMT